MKIISGGQTGVDRAALDFALASGVDCGGWCPAGRLDEHGRIPAHYPLQELSGGYAERTAKNVEDSDATVIIHSGPLTGGTAETARVAAEIGKPVLSLDALKLSVESAVKQLAQFVRLNGFRTLNIAGPRASEWLGGYDFARSLFGEVLLGEMTAPELSFVVPAHNEEHELPATLAAIHAAAEPTQRSYEIVVVDDASTDATARVAAEYGAEIIAVNRRQIAAVRNAGARIARGNILVFVDADTQIAPRHIAAALEALAAGYVGGSARVAVDRAVPIWARLMIGVFSTFYFAARLGVGAFLFTRRESFEAVGGFDEQYFAGEEYHLSLSLKKRGRFKIIDEPIVTSARKIRMHTPRFVLMQSIFIIFGGKRALRRREKLDLWYDGRREQPL